MAMIRKRFALVAVHMRRAAALAALAAALAAGWLKTLAAGPAATDATLAAASPAGAQHDEFPPALEPQQALATIAVPAGLRVELVAAEPLVMDPIDIAWGPDGRLWVVEMGDYPRGLDDRGQAGGRVRFLQDTDGDGRYDRSTLFLDGLPFPTTVMPWRDGVLIGAAPDLLWARDTDGDGRADERQVLYTGFGEGNQQHRVNGLRFGLDNWIYLANGDSDGQIRSLKTGAVVDVRGRDLRIRPDEGLVDAQTGRAQFGRNRDDWGNWFGGNNSNPMWYYALEDHYVRRNAFLAAPRATVAVSEQPGAAPVFPRSRTLLRFNEPDKANRFTSACSPNIYRDDVLGAAYAGNALVCEPVHNLVHREVMQRRGVLFVSRRAASEQHSEFLASTDNWFRPTAVHTGPDGALYVVDMYRLVIEHPQWIPEQWQRKLDLRAGHDRGRIYRVVPAEGSLRRVPRLDQLSTAELVTVLESRNGPLRDLAQQMLLWRADAEAIPLLRAMLRSSGSALARLHALCTLDGLAALAEADLLCGLADEHPGVRRHALRLADAQRLATSAALRRAVLELHQEADSQVQMQLAYTLGACDEPQAAALLVELSVRHADDEYLLAAVFSSLHGRNVAAALESLLARGDVARLPAALVHQWFYFATALGDAGLLQEILHRAVSGTLPSASAVRMGALSGTLAGLAARPQQAATSLPHAAQVRLGQLVAEAWSVACDDDEPLPRRVAAVEVLGHAATIGSSQVDRLLDLLAPRNPPEVQAAALQALARQSDRRVAEAMLAGWNTHSPRLRAAMLEVLLSRQVWTTTLVAAMESGTVPAGALDASTRQRLLRLRDGELRQRIERLLQGATDPDRRRVVDEYRAALELPGDVPRGRLAFEKHCAACHRLQGVGHAVGPDLAALTDRSGQSLLVAMLDPNRAVEDRYLAYVATTHDGRIFTGILAEETSTAITLLAQEGKQYVILRRDLEELQSSNKSQMPEGMERNLSPQDVADLVAYLQSLRPAAE
jgi:putative membrane-bound dehydrogenase-like protein